MRIRVIDLKTGTTLLNLDVLDVLNQVSAVSWAPLWARRTMLAPGRELMVEAETEAKLALMERVRVPDLEEGD